MKNNTGFPETIDQSWTLFLDRDGVINIENVGSYITEWEEFRFYPGTLDAFRIFGELFGRIVVVTNQRGVGKGIMSIESLRSISQHMTQAIEAAGGRVDKIYTATAVNNEDHNRKPNTGMAIQAREDFPEIDFRKSIMVGNNLSDMEFGKRLAMHTVFLTTTQPPFALPHDLVDKQYDSLISWAQSLVGAALEDSCR